MNINHKAHKSFQYLLTKSKNPPFFGYPVRHHSFQIVWLMLVAASLFLSGCNAGGSSKTYRVGILSGLDYFESSVDGFKNKMAELGYVEGQDIVYDIQKANVDLAAYQSILQKFVADQVDLIYVFPTEASLEAKAATQGTDIPVVFNFAFIEGTNLVESVREPGGNVTGVRFPATDIAVKRLEILLELAPGARRIWIPYLQGYPSVSPQLEALRPVAENLGITLIEFPATTPQDLQTELEARAASDDLGLDAILLIAEPVAVTPDFFAPIGKFAYEHQVPVGGSPVAAGDYSSIFGLIPDIVPTGEQAALLADKILKGTTAGTIPVVSPENYFSINYKAAQALGVIVPEELLQQADEIVR